MNKLCFGIIAMISILLVAACGGVEIGEIQSEKASINMQEEKSLDVSIRLGAGDLTINGDTPKAAEADFTYNVDKLKPVVDYQVSDGVGKLSIYQSNMNKPLGNLEGLEYKGDVKLNSALPMKLYVKTGAGTNLLDLRTLRLQNAEIFSGVGQTTIDMNGVYKENFDVTIESGMGNTKIIVPNQTGIKIFVESGIGQVETKGLIPEKKDIFKNDIYDKSKVKINMKIKMGVGDLQIVEGE